MRDRSHHATRFAAEVQNRILEVFASDASLDEVLNVFCSEAEAYIGPEARASLALAEDGTFVHAVGPRLPPDYVSGIPGAAVNPNVGTCSRVVALGTEVITTDISTDPFWVDFRELAAFHGFEAVWSFPIATEGGEQTLAALAVYVERGRKPTDTEFQFLKELAVIAGLAIRRTELESVVSVERRKLEHLLDGTGIGVWELDVPSGQTEASDSLMDILGLPRDHVVARDHRAQLDLVHPRDRERLEADYLRHARGELEFVDRVVRVCRNDGHWLSVSARASIMERDRQGTPLRVVGTIQDITEQRRARTRLQRLKQLESIGKLAGGIAHDFNNILVGVYGGIELALSTLEDAGADTDDLRLGLASLDRARNLTRQLLTFAQGGTPVVAEVDVGAVACEVLHFGTVGSEVDTSLDVPPDLWAARADASQIQQVFANLVGNACDAIDGRGSIDITLENRHLAGHPDLKPGRYLYVTIRDTGQGIPVDELSHIFDPYFSTKANGMGIGLATVRSILSRHGGSIEVNQRADGTEFAFYIPAADTAVDVVAAPLPSSLTAVVRRESLSILVVDDEHLVRRVAGSMLEALGHEAACVDCGEAGVVAYRRAQEDGRPFDLVILDMTIPGGLGGRDALERFLAIDPHARVVASTGYTDGPVLSDNRSGGFVNALPKPYSIDELRTMLDETRAS